MYPRLLASVWLVIACAGAESRPTPAPGAHHAPPSEPNVQASAATPAAQVPSTAPAATTAETVRAEPSKDVSDKPAQAKPRARELHPQPDQTDCVEMYGSCTPLPDRVCTSQAFVLECGKSGRVPGSRELLTCVCP